MKTILYILLLLCILPIISCNKVGPDGPGSTCPSRFSKSYIDNIITVDTVRVYERLATIDESKKTIGFSQIEDSQTMLFIEDGITIIPWGMYTTRGSINPNNFKEKYNACLNQIGDTNYNRKKECDESISAIYDTLQSINISCSVDFDLEHLAGSSLNDLFTVYFENPYLIVKNNYQPYIGENAYKFSKHGASSRDILHIVIKAKLNEVNFSENPFIGNVWYCVLNKAPLYTDEYSFNIEVKKVNGGILTATSKSLKIKGRE